MASPFYRNRWSNYPRNPGGGYYYPAAPSPSPSPPARKVVSIPVHYVDSSSPAPTTKIQTRQSRSDSAAKKIQKVFRGFQVRKSLKKIAGIRNEVNAVEIRISDTSDLICRDPKERLKVNETLMTLLLKLDSVPGSDPGVRDFRKRIIKRAIALQEFVDSIANSGGETLESAAAIDAEGSVSDSPDRADFEFVDSIADFGGENRETLESAATIGADESRGDSVSDSPDQREIAGEESGNQKERSQSGSSESFESWTMVGGEEEEAGDTDDCGNAGEKGRKECLERDDEEEKRKNRELMEKMVEENERMMGMMKALYERNQMQTRLLTALSRRVEQLENAFICDKLRRRKRRNGLESAADYTPENVNLWKKL